MTLAALIRKRDTGKPATAIPAIPAIQPKEGGGIVARIATLAVASPTSPEVAPLPDQAAEARRQRVLAMLAEHPGIRYAMVLDDQDTDPVVLTLAIRGQATFELAIPAAQFDPFRLLDLIESHGGTMH